MIRYVAFLRAVNVGGHGAVPMAEVRKLYETLGLKDVRSYLQSGNLVFQSSVKESVKLVERLASAFEDQFGFRSETLLRTDQDLQKMISQNPWKDAEAQPSKLAVMFLQEHPNPSAVIQLAENFKGPERLMVAKREVYLFYPNGMGRSKLTTAFLEKQLGTAGTVRNWNTCNRVLDMCIEED